MVDLMPDVFDAIYNAVTAEYPDADLASHYVNQPSAFPHVQAWDESNTTPREGMNLSGDECFSNIVIHIEIFDNMLDGEGSENVEKILALIDPVMRMLGFRRTYNAPVPNYNDASVYRKVVRYTKLQPNNN